MLLIKLWIKYTQQEIMIILIIKTILYWLILNNNYKKGNKLQMINSTFNNQMKKQSLYKKIYYSNFRKKQVNKI